VLVALATSVALGCAGAPSASAPPARVAPAEAGSTASAASSPEAPSPARALRADAAGEVRFESASPYDLDVLLGGMRYASPTTAMGTLSLPPGASAASPVPAVVLLHGSGGIAPGREHTYARLLNAAGYAAFVVDYYASRGIAPDDDYMHKVLSVTEFDAITDAYRALELLSTDPAIDGDRIALAGFSYGGMAVRLAMDERIRLALAPGHRGFAAFVDFYGPCFQVLGTRHTNGAPLLTLRGSEDASNELAACARREDELRAIGVDVEAHVYPGAGHAWEVDIPRALRADAPYVVGCEMVYDEAGHSSVGGKAIVDVPVGTPRADRIALRTSSGDTMAACVKSGYVVGSDPATRARANADLLDFLGRALDDHRTAP